MPNKHKTRVKKRSTFNVEMKPYFVGNVFILFIESPLMSAASLTNSLIMVKFVARKKGINILLTYPNVAASVNINTEPTIIAIVKFPNNGIFFNTLTKTFKQM